ncbi:hypothetical protein DEU56DRAFT_764012 [Suillus clintonianus]|uniref:uncharacterized protein n=1 Tax=Suillus clintonianus TaxID=1904413 RepID=UPI001B86FCEA|nr:uncharacterized protein DEU56DRAFT_764012 [Suillus clintonianus]KAG2157321.1 hypothetical protein DEU56DRAFT_764012 [Suillus clintonianus]
MLISPIQTGSILHRKHLFNVIGNMILTLTYKIPLYSTIAITFIPRLCIIDDVCKSQLCHFSVSLLSYGGALILMSHIKCILCYFLPRLLAFVAELKAQRAVRFTRRTYPLVLKSPSVA